MIKSTPHCYCMNMYQDSMGSRVFVYYILIIVLWNAWLGCLAQYLNSSGPTTPLPTYSGPPCRITQYGGHQHFGLQLEAKISCVLLSMLDPNRFHYFHTPFEKVDGSLEAFMNLGSGRNISQFATKSNREAEIVIAPKDMEAFGRVATGKVDSHCSAGKEYIVEGCWELLYEEPYVSHIDEVRGKLREQYLLTKKPDTGLDLNKKNVVVFIREQDTSFVDIELFYESAINYFANRYEQGDVCIWIESEKIDLPIFNYLTARLGYLNMKIPKIPSDADFFRTFHRMALSYGLVFVPSNFAVSASLLSPADTVIVPIADHASDHMRLFSKSERYTQINFKSQRTVGVLGYTNTMLVNMVHPVDKAHQCPVTVYGVDGFGHQLEGKLSCALLSLVWPARFPYRHIPFVRMEHLSGYTPQQVDDFVNLGAGFPHSQQKVDANSRNDLALRGGQLDDFVNVVRRVDPNCDPNREYIIDNCWGLTYIDPALPRIEKVRHRLRDLYLQSSKPETGFDATRKNIIVHMRNGDAESQERFYGLDPSQFFKDGMNYFVKLFNNSEIVFWIETDDVKWKPVTDAQEAFLNKEHVTVHAPDTQTPVLTVFHRMVMADGLVMSPSSFSNSAAMLSAAERLVIPKGFHGVHVYWMSQERFVQLT
jgi:hypothetical protein